MKEDKNDKKVSWVCNVRKTYLVLANKNCSDIQIETSYSSSKHCFVLENNRRSLLNNSLQTFNYVMAIHCSLAYLSSENATKWRILNDLIQRSILRETHRINIIRDPVELRINIQPTQAKIISFLLNSLFKIFEIKKLSKAALGDLIAYTRFIGMTYQSISQPLKSRQKLVDASFVRHQGNYSLYSSPLWFCMVHSLKEKII